MALQAEAASLQACSAVSWCESPVAIAVCAPQRAKIQVVSLLWAIRWLGRDLHSA